MARKLHPSIASSTSLPSPPLPRTGSENPFRRWWFLSAVLAALAVAAVSLTLAGLEPAQAQSPTPKIANLVAERISGTQTLLRWDAYPNAASYQVHLKRSDEPNFPDTADYSALVVSSFVSTLTPGTGYTAKVTPLVNGDAIDAAAATVTFMTRATPDAPTNLTATAVGTGQIDLSWTAPASGSQEHKAATSYLVQVSTDDGNSWTDLAADTGNANTTYSHTGLAAATTRHYRVYARNPADDSGPSNTANATTLTVAELAERCGKNVPFSSSGSFTESGLWASNCASVTHGLSLARWYTFTLGEKKEVRVTMSSSETVHDPDFGTVAKFSPMMYLRSGNAFRGSYIAAPISSNDTSIYRVLNPGTYTVEATNSEAGETGSFSIIFNTRALTDPPAPTGAEPASCDTVNLTKSGTYTGQWDRINVQSPDKPRELLFGNDASLYDEYCAYSMATGGQARFYDFHVTSRSVVTITLASDHATPRLFLRDKNPWMQIRSGRPNLDRIWFPHWIGEYSNGDSRIRETLEPGSYTIWATTNEAGQRGDFTLTVSGSITAVPPLPVEPYPTACADTPNRILSAGTTASGQWGPGCETDTFYWNDVNDYYMYARFYDFTVDERKRVKITLTNTEKPQFPEIFVLRKQTALGKLPGRRDYGSDFDGVRNPPNPSNFNPKGAWSDGNTMWVADGENQKIYAYKMGIIDNERDTTKEFDLHADAADPTDDNADPTGIWSDGETMWVADEADDKLYAYNIETTSRETDKEFDLHADNGNPTGIWSDNATMWVADGEDGKLYAYNLSSGASSTDFDLHTDNANPYGIWSDGTFMWALDDTDLRIYAYSMETGNREEARELSALADIDAAKQPRGIWSDGETMWVVTEGNAKIYAYDLHAGNDIRWGAILDSGPEDPDTRGSSTLAIDLGAGTYAIEALSDYPDNFTIGYTLSNPSSASDCYGRTIRENQEVEGRWFNDCPSSGGAGKQAAHYDLNVSGSETKRVNIRLRSYEVFPELYLWRASDFTGSGSNRIRNSSSTPLAANTVNADGQWNNARLHVDLEGGGNYVIEAVAHSVPSHEGSFKLGVTTGVEPPDYVPENCGAVRYDVKPFGTPLPVPGTELIQSELAPSGAGRGQRNANHNDPNHADYLPFGRHGGDVVIMLGQDYENLDDCNGGYDEELNPVGFPEWNFIFSLDTSADLNVSTGRGVGASVTGLPAGTAAPAYTLRRIDGAHNAPPLNCPESHALELPPCAGAGGNHPALEPGIYALTVTLDPPASDTGLVVPPGPFSVTLTAAPAPAPADAAPAYAQANAPENRPPNVDANISSILNTFKVEENSPAGTKVGSPIPANDPDGDTLTYSLSGDDAASFAIDSAGQITTVAGVDYDYENKSAYTPEVVIADGRGSSFRFPLPINLIDVNEAPVFADSSAAREVRENSPTGTKVGSPVTATDPDAGDTLTYSLSGDDAASFSIDAATGQLTTGTGVTYDYDVKSSYSLAVDVSDSDGLSDSIDVTVSLTELTENLPPVFHDGESTTRKVAENSPAGTKVGAPLTVYDPNGDALAYYGLDGADRAAFALGDDGQLTTVAGESYNYEIKPTYQFMVIVMETDTVYGHMTAIEVTVKLTDVAESKPPGVNRAPVFKDSPAATRAVGEMSWKGSRVGGPVAATDPDEDPLTYSLSGTDVSFFEIDRLTAQIITKKGPQHYNYEAKSSYSLEVTANDHYGGTVSIPVTVNLIDKNDLAFFGSGSYTREVAENSPAGTNVGLPVSAIDEDAVSLATYHLFTPGWGYTNLFNINANTGQVTTGAGASFDYEAKSSYKFKVQVLEGCCAGHDTNLTINITNVNEAPAFAGSSATRSVPENSPPGTKVGALITATDPDAGDTLTYTLSGTDAASFEIGGSTGQITTKSGVAYDYEAKSSYSLTVEVSDSGGLTDSIDVTVNLTEVAEAPQ